MRAENRPRRVHIGRLELDLRGVPPATAQAAAQALGPALKKALGSSPRAAPTARLDAGHIEVESSSSPQALADGIARRLVARLNGEGR